MDAHKLRIARKLGGVTTDISSRPQVFVSDNPKSKKELSEARAEKKKKGGLFGLFRLKKPR
ncbi:MAG: hypothetical protein JSV43_07850 [Methanobacteriota archaeon]|nr:MAG: hypothetical protein JSV43_07850 [Euryarchaeota archaeon]